MKVAVASNIIYATPSAGSIIQPSAVRIKLQNTNNNPNPLHSTNASHTPSTSSNYTKPNLHRYSSAFTSSAITPAN